jgi:glucoamylase
MSEPNRYAPGQPGLPPRWTSSAKSGVGTSLTAQSRVWFTIGSGVLNEIYYPNVDQACVRDLQFLVSDGKDFFSEEQKDTDSEIFHLADGVPAYRLVNTCKKGRYRIEKEIIADPLRDVVLQRVRFVPLSNSLSDYHLYALLSSHLGNRGSDNTGYVDKFKGDTFLFADSENAALALLCSSPWLKCSAGFAGVSGGWQDIHEHKQMEWTFTRAENGNITLTGEIDLNATGGEFILALGFGSVPSEAGHRARASLFEGFEASKNLYAEGWRQWLKTLYIDLFPSTDDSRRLHHTSAAILRIHEAKRLPGGIISSLSVPWGFTKGDDDLGGYHLVWPRDLVEAAGALLAIGAKKDAHRVVHYLHCTQEPEGSWPQNMWLDGSRYWHGIQMNETAHAILLVDLAWREEGLDSADLAKLWPMVKKAAGFIARNGPVTQQDRWEEDSGYSPSILAVEIAALLAAADIADANREADLGIYLREVSDYWNANIERWTYVRDTVLARQVGVEGYYVRIAPSGKADSASPTERFMPIKHRAPDTGNSSVRNIISPDVLALVRFGLRMPDDPRIADTMKVVDAALKVETPQGPLWHRYSDDQYGEYEDGRPFDGSGKGRLWPLLTGERAHFELAAGRREEAERLLNTLAFCATEAGMLPEQIWDTSDIPERQLFLGKPTGSAMPLVWAHAEYLKLIRSLYDGKTFDMPAQTVQRYLVSQTDSPFACWKKNHKIRMMPQGKVLRLESLEPGIVHWSADNWKSVADSEMRDTGVGLWLADLPTTHLPPDTALRFTFYWHEKKQWEGKDFEVKIVSH